MRTLYFLPLLISLTLVNCQNQEATPVQVQEDSASLENPLIYPEEKLFVVMRQVTF